MKRYRLKKDLPTFKAGETFELWDSIETQGLCRESDGVMAYHQKTLEKFPNILTDWFEEIETTRWKPETDQKYYYVRGDGSVDSDIWDDYFAIDNGRFEIGNCFKTKEEAERAVEKLYAWKRLKDKGFRFDHWNKEYGDIVSIIAKISKDAPAIDVLPDMNLLFGGEE